MKRMRLYEQSVLIVGFAAVGTQGPYPHGQGFKEIRGDRRLGVPGVGRRRCHEADRHRHGETMLQLPCAPEGAGLHLLEVSRVTTRGDRAVGMKAPACRRRRRGTRMLVPLPPTCVRSA